MTRIYISTEPTPHEQPVGFHIIDGARQCLLSAPKLTAARFRLRLTDTGQSLLILPAPSTQAVVLRRQHSSPTTFGHGLWHIDFTATQGKLHTQNTVVTLPMLPTMLSPTPPACTPATNTIATVTPNAPAPLLSLSLPDTSTPYQNPSNTPMLNIHTLYEHRWRGRNYSRDHVDTPTYLAYIGSLTPTALTLDAPRVSLQRPTAEADATVFAPSTASPTSVPSGPTPLRQTPPRVSLNRPTAEADATVFAPSTASPTPVPSRLTLLR